MAGFEKKLDDKFFELSEKDENGYRYYIIPKGTTLYRGDTQLYLDYKNGPINLPNKPTFFAKEYGVAEKYGVVYEFNVDREYRLLAIDDRETILKLYDDLENNTKIRNILKGNYGALSGIRLTDMTDDINFSNYLCKNGFDGYSANQMPTNSKYEDGTIVYIHRELMICNTKNVSLVNVYSERDDLNQLISEHKSRNVSQEMKVSRKTKKRFYEDNNENNNNENIFHNFQFLSHNPTKNDQFSFSTPPPPPPPLSSFTPPRNYTPTSLFYTPGGKKKSNKTRKLKKNKSTKKSNKKSNKKY
jgi:hypothetical protein